MLTAPGQSHTATYGAVTLQAQLTVDGGHTITVWCGPDRANAVTFTYADRQLARTRYAQIAHLAATGASPADIDRQVNGGGHHAINAVRDILTDALDHVTADPAPAAGALSVALADAAAALEDDAERARLDDLANRINADLDGCTPTFPARTFAELRDRHAAALARDRARMRRRRPAA